MPDADAVTLDHFAMRSAAGDEAAFAALVEHVSGDLLALAAKVLGEAEVARDVLQEALVRAYAGLIDGRYTPGTSVQAWLRRIVVNAALDHLRQQRRRSMFAQHFSALPERVATAGGVEGRVRMRELYDAMKTLPPEQQVALALKELEGLTSRQIAAMLDCSEGAVEQRLVRARASLRARLGETE